MGDIVDFKEGSAKISRRQAIRKIGLGAVAVGLGALGLGAYQENQEQEYQNKIKALADEVRKKLESPPTPDQKRWNHVKVTAAGPNFATKQMKEAAKEPVNAWLYPSSYLQGKSVTAYKIPLGTQIQNVLQAEGIKPYTKQEPALFGAFTFESINGNLIDSQGRQINLKPKDVLFVDLDNIQSQSQPSQPLQPSGK